MLFRLLPPNISSQYIHHTRAAGSRLAKEGKRTPPRFLGCVIWGYKDALSNFSFFSYPLLTPIPSPYLSLPLTPSFIPQGISTMTTPIRTLPGTTIQVSFVLMLLTSSTECWGHRGVRHDIFLQRPVHPYLRVASVGFSEISRKHSRQLRSRHTRWCGRHRKR